MCGIFTYIWWIFIGNVGKYSIPMDAVRTHSSQNQQAKTSKQTYSKIELFVTLISCKVGYNPISTFLRPFAGVIAQFLTGRGRLMYENSKNDWLISAAPRSARSSQGSPAVWFPHHDELTHDKWPCPKHHHPPRKPGFLVQWIFFEAKWTLHLGNKNMILERGDLCLFSAISSTTRHVSMVCTCVY